jgi:hypothetical protein
MTLRLEVEKVVVRGAVTQVDVVATLVNPPGGNVNMYDVTDSIRPSLIDRTNLLRYEELCGWGCIQEYRSLGDIVSTHLEDGKPHRFRWTFPALVAPTDTVSLLVGSNRVTIPELSGLPVTAARS